MKISPLSRVNIKWVIEHLSEMSKKETEIFGMSIDQLRDKFFEMIEKPFTGAFYGEDDVCCAICGLEAIGSYRRRVHFVSTEGGLKKIMFEITQFLKKISDDFINQNMGKTYIEILSDFNEKTDGWHKAMGFKLVETDGLIYKYEKGE